MPDTFYALIVPMAPPGPVDPGYGKPSPPLGIWGPPGPWPTPPIYYPPVHPMPPIYYPPNIGSGPGVPTHPIVLPPQKPGEPPLGIWGGANQPFPTPPIYLPGDKPTDPPKPAEGWSWAYSPVYGWVVLPPGGGGKPQPPPQPAEAPRGR